MDGTGQLSGGYSNAGPLNAGMSAPVGGRRRGRTLKHKHSKGMKKVSARTIRSTLRKLHMKPKGRVVLRGGDVDTPTRAGADGADGAAAGGRRGRPHRKGRNGLFSSLMGHH